MSTQTTIRVSDSTRVYYEDPGKEVRARFHDVKDEIRQRESFEVTNRHVLSILLDIYWLHAENGGEA